jgi:hypothetical protein
VNDLIVYDIESTPQGSPEWFEARRGKITSSEFSKIMAESEERKGRLTLLRTLAGETVSGHVAEGYVNAYMQRGKDLETEALDWYARTRFADIERAGFIFDPQIVAGWSPDAIVGEEGAVEVKTAAPHLLIPLLEKMGKGEFPNEHKAQCQGGPLWIGRRRWVDLVIYFPGMPRFVMRAEPEAEYHGKLDREVKSFNRDLADLVARVRSFGP